jgi:uncharacterized integral membrane protein
VSRRGDDIGHQEVEPLRLGRWIVLAVVLAAVVTFVAQNREEAPVQFLWLDGTVPVWLVAILAVAVGAVIGLLVGWIKGRRRS